MPVIWFTGFNGTAHKYLDLDTVIDSSVSNDPPNSRIKPITNYVNRLFGRLNNDIEPSSPIIRTIGRKWSTGSQFGYVHAWVDPAPWDATSNALHLGISKSTTANADFKGGLIFSPPVGLTGAAGKKWRLGFRLAWVGRRNGAQVQLGEYAIEFGVLAAEPIAFHSDVLWTTPKVPYYYEIEFTPSTNVYDIYKDGVWVKNGNANLGLGFCLFSEVYAYNNWNEAFQTAWAISDMYWQTIESSADVALGPATIVKPIKPLGDDQVQFTRPSEYGSNASVVSGPTGISPLVVSPAQIVPAVDGKILTSDGVNQQDLYNLDISEVTSRMSGVEAVVVRTVFANPGTVPTTAAVIAKQGATQVQSGAPLTLTSAAPYASNTLVLASDPSDGSRWSTAKLATLKIGTKVLP